MINNNFFWYGNNFSKVGQGVVIDENVTLGKNVFIGHNTVIRSGVTIGDNTVIGHLVVIEADTKIGNNVTIQSQCHITKLATIEDRVFFGPKAMLINTHKISHGRNFEANLQGPTIKYGARIGAGAVIMPGIVIGREAMIGANSTVTKDCKDFGIYIGSPAGYKKDIDEKEKFDYIPYTEDDIQNLLGENG